MASNTSRTISLTLNANTTGSESVKALAEEMKQLAKTGGDAAPEAAKLAKELEAIAKQQSAVENLESLAKAADDAKVALSKAETEVKTQGRALKQLKSQLDTATQAERDHAAQIKAAQLVRAEAKASYEAARTALARYTAEIGGAKSANAAEKVVLDEKRASLRQLKAAYEESKSEVSALIPEMIRLKDAAAPLVAEYSKQQREMAALTKESESAKQSTVDLAEASKQAGSAAQALGVDTAKLASEQNRLAQSMASLKAQADGVKSALAGPGTAATQAADRIENAFGVVGVRSASAIKAEILKVNQALMALARESSLSGEDFDRAFSAGKAKIADLEKQLRAAEGATKSFTSGIGEAFKQFGPASLVFNGVTAAINAMTGAASQIPKVTSEFQTMTRVLTVLTGSTSAAAKEFEYIKSVANRVGADIKGVGESYIKLAAATKETALAGEQTRRIFEAVSGAMGMLGASSADTENAMMAVTQMVSKGVVSMEEMRQQLGERLPGAFQVVAKELGITTSDLNDLISSGKMAAEQVLPALARGLEEVYKSGAQNDTLVGKWNQLTNALKDSANAIGDSGLLESLLWLGKKGAAIIAGLAEGFVFFGTTVGAVTAGIKNGNLSEVLDQLADKGKALTDRLDNIADAGERTKKSTADLAKEARAAGQDFFHTADGVKVATAAVLDYSDGVVKFMVESTKAETRAETLATLQRKLAESTRAAGESATTAANALGDEADKRRIAIQVADDNRRALESLLAAEKAVLAVMDERAMRMVQEVAAKGQASDADRKMLDDLDKELQKRKATVDGVAQQVEALGTLKMSLQINAEVIKDHSKDLESLRATSADYSKLLETLRLNVAEGTITQAELNKVEQEAMKIKALYKDAISDQIATIEALNKKKQGQLDIDSATIRLSIEQQRTIYEVAKARGDEYTAANAMLKIKQLEIQLSELQAKAKRAEAEASLAKIQLDREELQVKGMLTEAASLELQAREAAAGVKLKEAEIASELAKRMRELVGITQTAGSSAGNASGGFDKMADSMNNAAAAARNLKNAQSGGGGGNGDTSGSQPGIGASGSVMDDPTFDHSTFLTPGEGLRGNQQSYAISGRDIMYKQGATVAEAAAAEKFYGELVQRNMLKLEGRYSTGSELAGSQRNFQMQVQALEEAAREAVRLARLESQGAEVNLGNAVMEERNRNLARTDFRSLPGNLMAIDRLQSAGREAAAKSTVTINIGGQKSSINVASQNDANQLVSTLRLLEQQSQTAY